MYVCIYVLKFDSRGLYNVYTQDGMHGRKTSLFHRFIVRDADMSPWVLPERTLGTVRYTETYPGNYLICRTVPCLLSTVP